MKSSSATLATLRGGSTQMRHPGNATPEPEGVELGRFLAQACCLGRGTYAVVDTRWARAAALSRRADLSAIITPGEQDALGRLTSPKRRLQWLAGRCAAKVAVMKQGLRKGSLLWPDCLDVLRGPSGHPHVVQYPELHLSIAHSGRYAIAVAAERPVGIDLEAAFVPHPSLLARYYHAREVARLAEQHSRQQVGRLAALYWTRKEALSKLLGLGMRMDFAAVDATEDLLPRSDGSGINVHFMSRQAGRFSASVAWE